MGSFRSPLQAFHHLQLKDHVFLRLVLVCVGEVRRQELKASLLQTDQLFHRLDGDIFDFHKVVNVPQQVLQYLKAVDFMPILQRVSWRPAEYADHPVIAVPSRLSELGLSFATYCRHSTL